MELRGVKIFGLAELLRGVRFTGVRLAPADGYYMSTAMSIIGLHMRETKLLPPAPADKFATLSFNSARRPTCAAAAAFGRERKRLGRGVRGLHLSRRYVRRGGRGEGEGGLISKRILQKWVG